LNKIEIERMPSFKPKTAKKIKYNKRSSVTLDTKHKEFLNEFNKDEKDRIPHLKLERQHLKNTLKDQSLNIEQRLDVQDKIIETTEKIKEIQSKKKDYFLDNSKYIFEYFENKKNISEGNNLNQFEKNKTNMVNYFFKIKTNEDDENLTKKDKNNIVQKYLSNIDDGFLDVNAFVYQSDICQICFKGELIPLEDEGVMLCNTCSRSIPYLIENEKPSYKEPPKEVCFYAYKRINHFKEILAQFQGKETTQIPPIVIENIKMQIKKQRIELHQITNAKTKEILKNLSYNKYYEHIPHIINRLNGQNAPFMSREDEEKLRHMFREIQPSFKKHCPKGRRNFLSYSYVLYKFCELLEMDEYLACFPLLKNRDKLYMQDKTWKLICEDMGGGYIRTCG
jgi:hypothetical protein